ncbi:MAG: CBS domain-containing protein [Thermoprotei archaeon]
MVPEDLIRNLDQEQVSLLLHPCSSRASVDSDLSDVLKAVVNNGYVCVYDSTGFQGIVYVRDLLQKLLAKKEYESFTISKLISKKVALIWANTPARLACSILAFSGHEVAVVVDESTRVLGQVSFTDFLELATEERVSEKEEAGASGEQDEWGVQESGIVYIDRLVLSLPSTPVGKSVRPLSVQARPSESVASAASKMCVNHADIIPVTDADGGLVGTVSGRDMLKQFYLSSG